MGIEIELSKVSDKKKNDDYNNHDNNETKEFLPKPKRVVEKEEGVLWQSVCGYAILLIGCIAILSFVLFSTTKTTLRGMPQEDHTFHNDYQDDDVINEEEAILKLRVASLEQIIAPLLLPSSSSSLSSSLSLDPHLLLRDLSTPYSKAFSFLVLYDTRTIDSFSTEGSSSFTTKKFEKEMIQRFIIALLFYSTGGDEVAAGIVRPDNITATTTGWKNGNLHFLSSLHECHWNKKLKGAGIGFGFLNKLGEYVNEDDGEVLGIVGCNDDLEVTHVNLAGNNLFGTIPFEIKYLTKLQSLDLRNNRLSGPIPHTIGDLRELKFLSLDGNKFVGSIPDSIGFLDKLESVYLNFNDLSGNVPETICPLRNTKNKDNGGGGLQDLWADCGSWPLTCKCCTVCCDVLSDCEEVTDDNNT
mmetsp:Transcript_12792/g.18641  ORF Transcript_12792/g.18641 Transcript_12792/m.18641 type:complete len:413 (-) Transcript_12792:199-1437(-)